MPCRRRRWWQSLGRPKCKLTMYHLQFLGRTVVHLAVRAPGLGWMKQTPMPTEASSVARAVKNVRSHLKAACLNKCCLFSPLKLAPHVYKPSVIILSNTISNQDSKRPAPGVWSVSRSSVDPKNDQLFWLELLTRFLEILQDTNWLLVVSVWCIWLFGHTCDTTWALLSSIATIFVVKNRMWIWCCNLLHWHYYIHMLCINYNCSFHTWGTHQDQSALDMQKIIPGFWIPWDWHPGPIVGGELSVQWD